MDLYPTLLFLHVAAAIAMFCGWAIEIATLSRHDGSPSGENSMAGMNQFAPLAPIGMVLTLFTGLAMMVWRWDAEAWMLVSIAGIGILIAGGILLEKTAAARKPDRPSEAIGLRRASVALRIGIGLAILALMIVKPGLAISTSLMAIGAIAGLAFMAGQRKHAR